MYSNPNLWLRTYFIQIKILEIYIVTNWTTVGVERGQVDTEMDFAG